jgi:hypothetical protein
MDDVQQPSLSPREAIGQKIDAAKAIVTEKSVSTGAEVSWVGKVLHLLLDLIPEVVDLFHSKPAAPASAATVEGQSVSATPKQEGGL